MHDLLDDGDKDDAMYEEHEGIVEEEVGLDEVGEERRRGLLRLHSKDIQMRK